MSKDYPGDPWPAYVEENLEKGLCPYSGLPGPECKSWLCDCFEFDELWGPSFK